MKKIVFMVVFVLLLAVLVMGCTTPAPATDQVAEVAEGTAPVEAVDSSASATAADTTAEPASTTKTFEITARTWEFIPNTIEVNQGDQVRLIITSQDVEHGFALPEFGVNEQLLPKRTVEVQFVADKKGTFPFFCNVYCGNGHGGMRGQLIVR